MSFKRRIGEVRTISARLAQQEKKLAEAGGKELAAPAGTSKPGAKPANAPSDGSKKTGAKKSGEKKISNPEAKARFKNLAGRVGAHALANRGSLSSSLLVPNQLGASGSGRSRRGASPTGTLSGDEGGGGGLTVHGDSPRLSIDLGRRSAELLKYQAQLAQQQAVYEKKEVAKENAQMYNDSAILSAIPFLPLPVAFVCLLLNIVLPGVGTMLSGVAVMCCGSHRVKGARADQMLQSLCVNVIVGLSQFLTITFLLVGWFWSISWGINMVSLALERREGDMVVREKELTAIALTAFGGSSNIFQTRGTKKTIMV